MTFENSSQNRFYLIENSNTSSYFCKSWQFSFDTTQFWHKTVSRSKSKQKFRPFFTIPQKEMSQNLIKVLKNSTKIASKKVDLLIMYWWQISSRGRICVVIPIVLPGLTRTWTRTSGGHKSHFFHFFRPVCNKMGFRTSLDIYNIIGAVCFELRGLVHSLW